MKYRYLSDCHIHSNASSDGADAVEMLCENAVRMGLHAITITDHYECSGRDDRSLDAVRRSLLSTQKAAIMFRDRLRVYHGIELGQATQNIPAAEKLLSEFEFDFVLGSLHNVEGQPDFYYIDYAEADMEKLLRQYFEEILGLIQLGMFDSLAHLTYPLRYVHAAQHIEVGQEIYERQVDSILQSLARSGKALEINSSGLRQKIGITMPGPIVVKRFRELGGKYITVGSDAHRWADVGSGIEEAMDIAKKAGFDQFTVYEGRKPKLLPIA